MVIHNKDLGYVIIMVVKDSLEFFQAKWFSKGGGSFSLMDQLVDVDLIIIMVIIGTNH